MPSPDPIRLLIAPSRARHRGGARAVSRELTGRVEKFLALFIAALCCGVIVPPAASEAAVALRPCDLYALGGTPCVAAFSTTRALYAAFDGPLYQVKRASDGASSNIGVGASGYADAAAQDRFCARTTCEVTVLFDQSTRHNDLTIQGPGGNGGQDVGVVADKLRITVGGGPAYGMYFEGGMGYRNNHTNGVARGAQPESMYMVTSGVHFNSRCCFDFGNAETSGDDTGNGHMDAVYFGSLCWSKWPECYGSGPWVQADLENGVFMSGIGRSLDPTDTGNTSPFVTAMLKDDGTDTFAIKDASAQDGALATHWYGPLPMSPLDRNPLFAGYRPAKREGAIVLGTGGDNSNADVGSFFEGVMTRGFATDVTEDAVQANIAAAGYR
jgi:non-reducing end alpha-L-arabinofuranosidase